MVGAVLVGIYLWRAQREHLFRGRAKRPAPEAQIGTPVPVAKPSTIEGILDELLAGKITRDEAAHQLREIMRLHPLSL